MHGCFHVCMKLLLLLLLIFSILCCVTFSLLTPFHRLHFNLESPTDSKIPRHLCKVACSLPSYFISSLCSVCKCVPECAVADMCRSEDPLQGVCFLVYSPYGFLGLKSVFSLAANTCAVSGLCIILYRPLSVFELSSS